MISDPIPSLCKTLKINKYTLPMSDFVYVLMERRSRNKTSEFVFPAESKTGYIYEPKKGVE
ncbi:TPA: hypothetical protein ACIZCU_001049 [Legionella pneumophila]